MASTNKNSNYELVETDVMIGQVKWFNNKLNYGFITILSENEYKDKDIFVHQTNILPEVSNYRTLTTGEYVSFFLARTKENTNHQYHAIEIKGIQRGKLLCDFYNTRTRPHIDHNGQSESSGSSGPRGASNSSRHNNTT